MAKRKVYRPSTPLRYQYKMYRVFGGTAPEALVHQITQALLSQWNANYGFYKNLYENLKKQTWFTELPPGLRGVTRAFAFYVSRQIERGVEEAAIRAHGRTVFGLSDDIIENVISFVRGFRG